MDQEEKNLKFFVLARTFALIATMVRSLMWVAIVYLGYLSIKELSGKETDAKLAVTYLTSSSNDYALPWVFVFLLLVWALSERRLRLEKVEKFQSHIRELEKRLDPERTTSGLTPRGETNPADDSTLR